MTNFELRLRGDSAIEQMERKDAERRYYRHLYTAVSVIVAIGLAALALFAFVLMAGGQ